MGLKSGFHRYSGYASDDPMLMVSNAISAAISDIAYGTAYILKRFPTKTCGTLSLIANGVLTVEGVKTMNPYLLSASLPSLASDLTLIIYGDPLARQGEIDPQEKPFSWKDVLDGKNHPNEASNTLEGIAGVPLLMYGMSNGENTNPALMINGAADIIANFAVIRIRQKKEPTEKFEHSLLNKPIIKQIANKVETDPPFASSAISLSALCSVGAYEMAQGRGFVGGDLDPTIMIFSGFGIASELVHMFGVDKLRVHKEDSLSLNQNEYDNIRTITPTDKTTHNDPVL